MFTAEFDVEPGVEDCLIPKLSLQSIIEIALQQGIWAALYIYLFFRMLKENAEREAQYQQMIKHLSTNVVEGIADINDKLDDMARRLDNQSI